jgi:hypothetical protein
MIKLKDILEDKKYRGQRRNAIDKIQDIELVLIYL